MTARYTGRQYNRPFDRRDNIAIRKHLESQPDNQRQTIDVQKWRIQNGLLMHDKKSRIGEVGLNELIYKISVLMVKEGLV
jgi:hypothetical protein